MFSIDEKGLFLQDKRHLSYRIGKYSPCKSHSQPLIGPPTIGVLVAKHIIEDTWAIYTKTIGKEIVGKGRTCYLREYNPQTHVGVIFLGTIKKDVAHDNRFLPVYGGRIDNDGLPMSRERNFLLIVPPNAFKTNFYLNLSHPL